MSNWFAFRPKNDSSPGVIGMQDWLDAPAGKHGFCRTDGDRLRFEDGTPAVFWGVNNCNLGCCPEQGSAQQKAAHYAKYGVNAVRMHKFTNAGSAGIGGMDSLLDFDPEKLDLFDAYHAELRRTGIYYTWSAIFRLQPRPGDCQRLVAPQEIVTFEEKDGETVANGSTIGFLFLSEDVQDLHIDLTTRLLNHRNPHTGLRYADDPALAYVEFHNEDDIFFYTTIKVVERSPVYKGIFCGKFSDWLRERYGSHEGLVEAWGERAIGAYPEFMEDEHLDKRNIYPACSPWYFGPEGLKSEESERGTGRRLLDTARFCYELQRDFYARFEKAVRDTGYGGALVGSCWQAGEGLPHYYNLETDRAIGIIDRHNYFGGSGTHPLVTGPFNNASMLTNPGCGLLSSGMQQTLGRPFALSEWIEKIPTEWVAEGPALIAAYGMGLHGWVASFEFASDQGAFHDTIQSRTTYNLESPTQIGLYPALARMVLRGDVSLGDVVSVRRVSLDELARGELGFEEHVAQQGDIKSMGGSVPAEALAVGRTVVEFTDEPRPSSLVEIADHGDGDGALVSTTRELRWTPGTDGRGGWFSVDTPGTVGVVGFVPKGKPVELAGATIEVDNAFVVLFATAREPGATLADARSVIVTAVARARNTGMRYNRDHTELLDLGEEPVELEAVRATIRLEGMAGATVHLLDHDGRRTGVDRALEGGTLHVDGARDRTLYYEITR